MLYMETECSTCEGSGVAETYKHISNTPYPCINCNGHGFLYVAITPENCPGHVWVAEARKLDSNDMDMNWFVEESFGYVPASQIFCRKCGKEAE